MADTKKTSPSLVIVKLTKRYGCNNSGEVCGFTPDIARKLIESGNATLEREGVPATPGAAEIEDARKKSEAARK